MRVSVSLSDREPEPTPQPLCAKEDAREWDYYGTELAYRVCSQCPLLDQCRAVALKERPIDQMRAGVAFGPTGRRLDDSRRAVSIQQARARHETWWRMHRLGISYSEISRRVGVHHTTVIAGVQRVEAERRGVE